MPFILFLLSLSLTEVRVDRTADTTAKMVSLYPEIEGNKIVESLLFKLTNIEREKKGLKKLLFDRRLRIAARKHSNDMLNRNYLSHSSGDEISKTPLHRTYNSGLPVLVVGENVAENKGDKVQVLLERNPDSLARIIMDEWMDSPPHKKNILNPDFTHLGVGSISYKNTHKVTQNFADESDFPVDSVLAKIAKERYSISLCMHSFVSGISVFDNGKRISEDSLYMTSDRIGFSLKRDSGSHKIELCLREGKFYRCGASVFLNADSPADNIFQAFSSSYR
jgi:uncharacterized protein YkwD